MGIGSISRCSIGSHLGRLAQSNAGPGTAFGFVIPRVAVAEPVTAVMLL